MRLFRPIGPEELALIERSGMRRFPPRLPEQPIFYPVLNIEYARQIANEWNTVSGPGYAGYVTEFTVDDSYVSKFEVQTVGRRVHRELWVPAEELEEFNDHIIGQIKVVEAYYGKRFQGIRHELTHSDVT